MSRLYNRIVGEHLTPREKLFRIVLFIGLFAAFAGMIETLLYVKLIQPAIPMVIVDLLFIIIGVVSLVTNQIRVPIRILGFILIFFMLPITFFVSGGIYSGSSVWFVFSFFYFFMMFRGRELFVYMILNIGTILTTFGLAYLYPEWVLPIEESRLIYEDSLFGIICVGLFCGFLMKHQIELYEKERVLSENQKTELERSGLSKSQFFASISHELRTPISTVIGLNEMMLRGELSQEDRESAMHIKDTSNMLLNLVNDLLDMSQIELKKMTIVPTEYSPVEVFREMVEMVKVSSAKKKLEFIYDIDPDMPSALYGDAKRIKQVFLNLLTNAVKYTPTGMVIFRLRFEPDGEWGIRLIASVKDTGIGIKQEEIEHLFDTFHRSDVVKTVNIEGCGLGLSITKHLVDSMQGEIHVDSIYMKGSVFTATIPQKVIDTSPIGNITSRMTDNHSDNYYRHNFEASEGKLLIVDDNKMNALVAKKLLEKTKLQVDIATSGKQCLEMTEKKFYHVILLDNRMPDMDGPETFRQIKRQENGLCRETAVLLYTANSIAEARHIYAESRFDGFVEKPIQTDALERELLHFLPDEIVEYRRDAVDAISTNEPTTYVTERRKRIKLTADCACDLPSDLLQELDINVMYLYIKTRNGRFKDTREIDSDNLSLGEGNTYQNVFSEIPTVEEYESFFSEELLEAEDIIHISLSGRMGKCYQTACEAAKCFDHVHVIDAQHISCAYGMLLIQASGFLNNATSVSMAIEQIMEARNKIENRYVLPTLRVIMEHGHNKVPFGKAMRLIRMPTAWSSKHKGLHLRGIHLKGIYFRSLENVWRGQIRRLFRNKKDIDKRFLMITYVECSVKQREFIRNEVAKYISFDRIIMQKASVTIACNVGKNVVGFAFSR